MSCSVCKYWHRGTLTVYGDGSTLEKLLEKPKCSVLNIETPEDFGCIKFEEAYEEQVSHYTKEGAPWENWVYGPCPDCQGVGNNGSACHRCAGTAKVRFYDDGYVGEE